MPNGWVPHNPGAAYTVYEVAKQDATHRINLGDNQGRSPWLLVKECGGDRIDFACFEPHSGPATPVGEPLTHMLLFQGSGRRGADVEIWWMSEDRYTPVFHPRTVEAALHKLERWFDHTCLLKARASGVDGHVIS